MVDSDSRSKHWSLQILISFTFGNHMCHIPNDDGQKPAQGLSMQHLVYSWSSSLVRSITLSVSEMMISSTGFRY